MKIHPPAIWVPSSGPGRGGLAQAVKKAETTSNAVPAFAVFRFFIVYRSPSGIQNKIRNINILLHLPGQGGAGRGIGMVVAGQKNGVGR